eukprot:690643-Lingulodinium_polyedra.AAC.1
MALLARRFEPFADETALRSTFDSLNFNRRAGEKTDELFSRFAPLQGQVPQDEDQLNHVVAY